jgi:haloacetate dehalogenase
MQPMELFPDFKRIRLARDDVEIHAILGGKGPPLLLLHGYPQTHAIWHKVAPRLAERFTVVATDLRGYGDSSKPPGTPDHANYSKREMARDQVEVMRLLGFEKFFLAGHDRGGRVAHRLALDHPERVRKLAVLDIAPTKAMYEQFTLESARAYYHWFFLIQPAPLPEKLLGADPLFFLHAAFGGWGSKLLEHLEPQALLDYERCFAMPQTLHANCEDYRASAGIDLEHDRASRAAGQRIACDTLVLWGERGVVHRLFKPLDLWRAQCAAQVQGELMPAGHFIPEELPGETAEQLLRFFA